MIWAAPGPAGALPGLAAEEEVEQRLVWGIPAVAVAEILVVAVILAAVGILEVAAGIPAVAGSLVVAVAGIPVAVVAEIPAVVGILVAVEVLLPAAVSGSH